MDEGEGFTASFNMALFKLERLNVILKLAHQASTDDNHQAWYASLRALHREACPYFDKHDQPETINRLKQEAQQKLLEYIKRAQGKRNAFTAYQLQAEQLALESALDDYEIALMTVLKNHDFDMPAKEVYTGEEIV